MECGQLNESLQVHNLVRQGLNDGGLQNQRHASMNRPMGIFSAIELSSLNAFSANITQNLAGTRRQQTLAVMPTGVGGLLKLRPDCARSG
jgi:hypothetical protein